jgi:DNA-binding protein HU-beta
MRQYIVLILALWATSVSSFVVSKGASRPSSTSLAAVPKKTAPKAADSSETFKKADLIASIAEKSGLTKKDSETALAAMMSTIQEQLMQDKKVTLPGFGSFSVRQRSARKGRNPQTGEELDIAASKAPGFSAAKPFKDMLNGK